MTTTRTDKPLIALCTRIAALVCLAGFATTAAATDFPGRNDQNPNPPIVTGMLMANGIFDPADPNYTPPTPDDFDTIIMGRDAAQKAARKQLAIDYFIERYGIDLSAGFADNGNIVLLESFLDPRNNYRAYQLPGPGGRARSSRDGWIVYDRQYVMFVGALGQPSVLTGTWGGAGGTQVAPNTVAVDGDYLIQGTRKFRQGSPRNFYIRFQSADPIFDAANPAGIKFNCVLLDDHGNVIGAAIGRQELFPLNDGSGHVQTAIQNVWQFPAPLWALP